MTLIIRPLVGYTIENAKDDLGNSGADLRDYVKTEDLNGKLNNYVDKTELNSKLNEYSTKIYVENTLDNYASKQLLTEGLSLKPSFEVTTAIQNQVDEQEVRVSGLENNFVSKTSLSSSVNTNSVTTNNLTSGSVTVSGSLNIASSTPITRIINSNENVTPTDNQLVTYKKFNDSLTNNETRLKAAEEEIDTITNQLITVEQELNGLDNCAKVNSNNSFTGINTFNNTETILVDDMQWIPSSMPSAAYWYNVAYGNDIFVAVSGSGSDKAAYSDDGIDWVESTLPAPGDWRKIAFYEDTFVTVTYGSDKAAWSTNGIDWTESILPSVANWNAVCYGADKFVTVSYGANKVAYSTDKGKTWTASTLSYSANWTGIAYGNKVFVVVGHNTSRGLYSYNGINWTTVYVPFTANWFSVAFGYGMFLAVASGRAEIACTTDGITWTSRFASQMYTGWQAITFGEGKFVAVSATNRSDNSMYSNDGYVWYTFKLPFKSYWTGLIYGNGKFVTTTWDNTISGAYLNTKETLKSAIQNTEIHKGFSIPSGNIEFTANSSTNGIGQGIIFRTAGSDYARIVCGAAGSEAGYLEIAVADDISEPIYVRQYKNLTPNNFGTIQRTLTLLDASGNTIVPGSLTVGTTNVLTAINGKADTSHTHTSAQITDLKTTILQTIYPVGSIYTSMTPTPPNTLFGFGTWVQIVDRFLYCSNSASASTGGSTTHTHTTANHTLTEDQIPSHRHIVSQFQKFVGSSGTSSNQYYTNGSQSEGGTPVSGSVYSGNVGGSEAHNHGSTGASSNLPPYMTCYAWYRTI